MTGIKETREVIAEMLRENTGRSVLDSGDYYGRHWEANQNRDFEKEPEGLLHLPRWGGALSVPITEAVRFPLPSGNGTYVIYHLGSSP